ncbi:MAG: L-histidine N(alpha)-methyltransferase [Alphaproteobacteria bacterium]|nr:L-histidine N(alpha)-methyltransferase [Alphaproteobacteria bacterium]
MNSQLLDKLEAFYDLEPEIEDFGDAVLRGLSAENKTLPCKFFYDLRGSRLFDEICELDEYYVTRTEIGLLTDNTDDISKCLGTDCHLVEFGSGSSTKVRILLDAMQQSAGYTAIDISRDHLIASCAILADAYPGLPVSAVCADYSQALDFPALGASSGRPVAFFPGSSLGNFDENDAVAFLARVSAFLSKSDGGLLIGVDLKKDQATLNAAYDDAKGVTAAFNLNLLVRANTEIGANFDLSAYRHKAFYNAELGRVEMHLVSTKTQSVTIKGQSIDFAAEERIHTENSYKYSLEQFASICRDAGFTSSKVWCDANQLFSVHYLETS